MSAKDKRTAQGYRLPPKICCKMFLTFLILIPPFSRQASYLIVKKEKKKRKLTASRNCCQSCKNRSCVVGPLQVGTYARGILQVRYPVWPRYGNFLEQVSDDRHLTVATLEEHPFVMVENVDPGTGTCVRNTVPCRRQYNRTET